jgi:diguanylate cyclase (GGDEF)-like protein
MSRPFKLGTASLRPPYLLRARTGRTPAIAFVIMVVLSMVIVPAWSLLQARNVRMAKARVDTINMTRALAQHASDTIQAADVALLGVVQRLETEGMAPSHLALIGAQLRKTLPKLPSLSGLFVYDSRGQWLTSSRPEIVPNLNYADRAYFQYHAANADKEVHVGTPVRSRSTGSWVLPVSRRVDHADGSFAGVVVATIEIRYISEFHNSFDLGRNGTILLLTVSGKLVVRRPFDQTQIGSDATGGPIYQTYLAKGKQGSAVLRSRIDSIDRMYTYEQLDHYPLIVSSALAIDDVLAKWRKEAALIMGAVASLLVVLMTVGIWLIRQIAQREQVQHELEAAKASLEEMNHELERLAFQDSLTGLGNRRLFDAALTAEFERAIRAATPLSLIMVDVDYFKRYNDRYGHPAGDNCLRQLGETLKGTGTRPGDVAVRYGGEELAVLLSDTDEAGAAATAERFRLAVVARGIPHEGNPAHLVTVSVGVAGCYPGQDSHSKESLLASADKALYAAKAAGRNQVSRLPQVIARPPSFRKLKRR